MFERDVNNFENIEWKTQTNPHTINSINEKTINTPFHRLTDRMEKIHHTIPHLCKTKWNRVKRVKHYQTKWNRVKLYVKQCLVPNYWQQFIYSLLLSSNISRMRTGCGFNWSWTVVMKVILHQSIRAPIMVKNCPLQTFSFPRPNWDKKIVPLPRRSL